MYGSARAPVLVGVGGFRRPWFGVSSCGAGSAERLPKRFSVSVTSLQPRPRHLLQETDFIRRASRWAEPRQDVLRLLAIPIVLALLGATLALSYSLTQSTLYEARSTVVVSPGTKFLDPQ